MKWTIEYSKRAIVFVEEHGIKDNVRDLIRSFALKITGANINIDARKLKGDWDGYYRIRKGKVRIILKVDGKLKTIFIDIVDFRGSVYR